MITTDTPTLPVDALTPEAVKALVTTGNKSYYRYHLESQFSYREFTFTVDIGSFFERPASDYPRVWGHCTTIAWSTDDIEGNLDVPEFEHHATDRRKATIETMLTALGEYVCNTLKAVCNPDKLAVVVQERRLALEVKNLQYQQYLAEKQAKQDALDARLKGLIESGQIVAGREVGNRLDLVLTELMTVARLRMRNRRYNLRFAYDGVNLEIMKGNKVELYDPNPTPEVDPDTTQVRIKLRSFDEVIYADQDGIRVIGDSFSDGCIALPYTWVIPPDRLQQIEAALMELSRHDRLVEIMTNGKKLGECICCGKALTDPVSRSRWVGPECTKHFQGVYQFEDHGTQTRLLN